MRILIAILIFALPMIAALSDPGAGLSCISTQGGYDGEPCARRDARLAVWGTAYGNMTDEEKTLQAVSAVEDVYGPCLYEIVKRRSGNPDITPAEARLWVGARLNALNTNEVPEWARERCAAPSYTPIPGEQGGVIHKTLVIRGAVVANTIRRRWPTLPRIGNVAPLDWGTMTHKVCTVGSNDYDIYLSRHPWPEATLHAIHTIVAGEGKLSNFYLVNDLSELPCDEIK